MQVKRGDIIASDYGKGEIVAITDFWVIHKTKDGDEVAVPHKVDSLWIPVEIVGVDTVDKVLEIK